MRRLLPPLLLIAPAMGQLFLPSSAATTDANSVGEFAGFGRKLAQQFMIHERVLRPIAGRSLRSIAVRRNDALGTGFRSGQSRLDLWVTPTSVHPADARPSFGSNRGNPTLRFRGTVSLPASSPISAPPTWSATHSVKLPFQTPLLYRSGDHLCVDVRGEPTTTRSQFGWPIDYDHHSDLGTWNPLGQGCGIPRREFAETLASSARGLIAGGSLVLTARGLSGTVGIALIGGSTLGSGMPLDSIGMPGCVLIVSPTIQLPFVHQPSTDQVVGGTSRIQIPPGPSAVGGRLFAQVVNLETGSLQSNAAGMTTTNAVDLRISAVLPDPDVTSIEPEPILPSDPWPTGGDVLIGRGPVFRLETN